MLPIFLEASRIHQRKSNTDRNDFIFEEFNLFHDLTAESFTPPLSLRPISLPFPRFL